MAAMNFGKVDQPELAKHDSSVLDLAFVMDCTSSMSSYIRQAQLSIREIVEKIVAHESSDVHMALVEFRDHPPEDRTFVTRTHDFTPSIKTMKSWLDVASAHGGGDTPEAVADALHDLLKLSWRADSTKIGVLIVDAPPHGLLMAGRDAFPDGCPNKLDPVEITNELAKKGVTLYVVGCEPAILHSKEFYSAMAFITGGQYVPLRNATLLSQVIIGGALEEMSLQQLMAEVETDVQQEMNQLGGAFDESAYTAKLQMKFAAQGTTSVALQSHGMAMPEASPFAQNMSKMRSMVELKEAYKKNSTVPGSDFCAAPPRPRMNFSAMPTQMQMQAPMPLRPPGGLEFASPPPPPPPQFTFGSSATATTNSGFSFGVRQPPPAFSTSTFPSTGPAGGFSFGGVGDSPAVNNAMFGAPADHYSSGVMPIQQQQTQRLVQKAIMKQKPPSS